MARLISASLILALAAGGAVFAAAADAQPVTFHRDVAPILQQECQVCHRPNGANLGGMVAPMALTTYNETRPWAKSIAKQVEARTMPPWHASDHQSGVFDNERTLDEPQIDTLVRWAKAGAPEGDIADAPVAIEWPSEGGWLIGEPDLILTPDEAYFVEDAVEDHYVTLRTKMTNEYLAEDRYVKAIEFRPGSSVVHHIIVPSLGGIAPGNDPTIHRNGIGTLMKAGRDLRWQMHYHKEPGEGTGVWDQSQVAVKFYDEGETPEFEMQNADLGRFDFELPAGDNEVSIQTEYTFETKSLIVGYLPHMHLRGKSAKYEAIYPGWDDRGAARGAEVRLQTGRPTTSTATTRRCPRAPRSSSPRRGTTRRTIPTTRTPKRWCAGASRPPTR